MSYTNPLGQPQGISYFDTNRLRELLISEIIAINTYTEHILNSNNLEINMAWTDIIKDEKQHYAMLVDLLRKYDPHQYKAFKYHEKVRFGPTSPIQRFDANYDVQIILNNVREDIKGELEAIILYEQYADTVSHQDVKDTLKQIANDEKEHSEHLTQLLFKYEPNQYTYNKNESL